MLHATNNDLSLVVLPGPRKVSIIEAEIHRDAQEEEGKPQSEEPVLSAAAAVHPVLESEPVFFRPLLGLDQVGLDPVSRLLDTPVVHFDQTLRWSEELNLRTSSLGDV